MLQLHDVPIIYKWNVVANVAVQRIFECLPNLVFHHERFPVTFF